MIVAECVNDRDLKIRGEPFFCRCATLAKPTSASHALPCFYHLAVTIPSCVAVSHTPLGIKSPTAQPLFGRLSCSPSPSFFCTVILDKLPIINSRRIVLASGSPRRVELLKALGLRFEVVPSTFAEDLDKTLFATPAAYCAENARRKALEVWERLGGPDGKVDLVVGADTVVALDGRVIEKPRDAADACAILASLSGRSHLAITGLAVVWRNPSGHGDSGSSTVEVATEETVVQFSELSAATIAAYVATGSPLDKAGAYGIQDGICCSFISAIHGDYFNIVGLPVNHLCRILLPIVATWEEHHQKQQPALV